MAYITMAIKVWDVCLWIFSVVALSTDHVKGCDVIGLNLCTWKLGQNVTGSKDFTVLPSGSQIKKMCTHRDEFRNCYKPKLKKCSDTLLFVSTFATTQKTVEFICTVGYSDMISQDECWKKPEVQNRSNTCYKEHVENVKRELEQTSMVDDMFSDKAKQAWCKILQDSNECMHQSVVDLCEQPSVDVVTDMMSTVFDQMYSVMECQEPDRSIVEDEFYHYWQPLLENDCRRPQQTISFVLLILAIKIILTIDIH